MTQDVKCIIETDRCPKTNNPVKDKHDVTLNPCVECDHVKPIPLIWAEMTGVHSACGYRGVLSKAEGLQEKLDLAERRIKKLLDTLNFYGLSER